MLTSVKSRIIITILFFGVLAVGSMYAYISYTFNDFSNKTAKNSLEMLSQSIFQTVTQSMLAGDPEVVKETLSKARKIQGIESLDVSKSELVLEVYKKEGEIFTNSPMIRDVFASKEPKTIEKIQNAHHTIQLLNPMIADNSCISCHYNAKEGDILGVMNLVISLDENDKEISNTKMILLITLVVVFIAFAIVISISTFAHKT